MVSPVSNFTLEGFERFRVERRLGRGGFGEVFKAWDQQLERHVAIKLLSQYDPQAHLQLAGEFSRVQSIKHPNLVELYELLYIRRRPVLLMEYLPDAVSFPSGVRDDIWDREADVAMSMTTIAATRRLLLEEELQQPLSTPLPPSHQPRFFTAALGLLNGLDALHRRGLVHRDIKPSNVVLAEGRTVLLDYGLTMGDGGELIELAGTAGYIAPELLTGGRATRMCDIYSVGMLFARSLLGRLPSSKERATGVELYAHFLSGDRSDEFYKLLTRATSRVAEERPTVTELIDVIQTANDDQYASRPSSDRRVGSQQELVDRITAQISDHVCVLRGPIGAGKTGVINDSLAKWSSEGEHHEVFRVDAASESFDRLLGRIVHTGAERLMGFAERDEVPVRGLRISNQLAVRFPVIEAALENLGMPRQLGATSSTQTSERDPQLVAQWLRALYHKTPWIVVIEHVDPTDADIVGFIETLFQQGEFAPCGGALVSSTFRLDGLSELPRAVSFDCQPLTLGEIEDLMDSISVPFDDEQRKRAAEKLKALTRGFRKPLNQLIVHLSDASKAVAKNEGVTDAIRQALSTIIGGLSPEGVAVLWVVSAARSPVRPQWLKTICSMDENIDVTLQNLGDLCLIDRTLLDDGAIAYLPYSPELSRLFLEYVSLSTFPADAAEKRLEALSGASISGTHLVARLYSTFENQRASSSSYRRCIRLLLRSHRYDQALKVCEEFMGQTGLTDTDFRAIASVFIHCRRPLEASIHMERYGVHSGSDLALLARRIRWEAGDRRDERDGVQQSTTRLSTSWSRDRITSSLIGLYHTLKSEVATRLPAADPSLVEDFSEVHPSLVNTFQLFKESRWLRCLEATTSNRWVELDDPAELISLLRLYDYIIARSQFFLNRPLSERIVANPEGSLLHVGNQRFQTAISYLNVGWLLGLQEGSVLEVVRRVDQCAEVLDEYKSGPDLRRLLNEAQSAKRILQGRHAASDIALWPRFTSELVSQHLTDFFDARETADEQKAREVLTEGFRQSYHGGSKLIASVLLMLFGRFPEERLFAERVLKASGWKVPDVAACLLMGLSRDELYELRAEISSVEGIQLPSQTTFDIRSFVGARRSRT